MKATGKFLHIERLPEDTSAQLIKTPEYYKQANPFQRGIVKSKGDGVGIEVVLGDVVIFRLFNATSLKGNLYHVHQDYIDAVVMEEK